MTAAAVAACALGSGALAGEETPRVSVSFDVSDAPARIVLTLGANQTSQEGAALHIDPAGIHIRIVDDRGRTIVAADHFHSGISGAAIPTTIPFTDDQSPPPGMYSVEAQLDAQAIRDSSGAPVAIQTASYPANFYIAAGPDHPPALEAGQRFISLSTVTSNIGQQRHTELADELGNPVALETIGLHPLTLTGVNASVSPHRLTFTIEGGPCVVLRSDADATHLPGLNAIVEDADVRALEARYAGRTVALIGGTSFDCVSGGAVRAGGSLGSAASVSIDHVYRAAGAGTQFSGIGNLNGMDQSSAFFTPDPLVVRLHIPPAAAFTAMSFTSTGTAGRTFDLHAGCAEFTTRAAGRWDFERRFSIQTIAQAHPEWSPATRKLIAAGAVRRGMTHEMIAWMFGYPPVYGTRRELDALTVWQYQMSPPFSFTIYFKGDRVDRYDPPGELP